MKATSLAARLPLLLGAVFLLALTGCVGYVDGGYGGGAVVVAQPDAVVFGGGYYGGGYDHGRDVHGYSQRGAVSRGGGGHPASVSHGGGGHGGGGGDRH